MSRVKSNPLSTRFVQPGRLSWYADDPKKSLESLQDRFTNQLNWRAAIVGPHGSGKSTLLEHLVPRVGQIVLRRAAYGSAADEVSDCANPEPEARRATVWLKLRGRAPSVALLKETQPLWSQPNRLLVIDGYEQLPLLSRATVVLATARTSVGLLITSHRRTCLPPLIETQVDVQLAQQLLDRLLPADLPDRARNLDPELLNRLIVQHNSNLREVFMQLYDDLEGSRP